MGVTAIFAKQDRTRPVPLIFDRPMAAPKRQQGGNIGLLGSETGNPITDFGADDPRLGTHATPLRPQDLLQSRPIEIGVQSPNH
jgi:hypothetical protein